MDAESDEAKFSQDELILAEVGLLFSGDPVNLGHHFYARRAIPESLVDVGRVERAIEDSCFCHGGFGTASVARCFARSDSAFGSNDR